MFRLFKSDFFNFEALRLLSFTAHEGGEIAEFFTAVARIKDQDVESWYTAWMEAADKAEVLATEAELAGNRVAARRAYLRVANYQRSAQFMLNGLPGTDSRLLTASEAAISNFSRAAALFDWSYHRIEIPYEEGLDLPGYVFLPHPSTRLPGGKLPLLIQTVGADATQEEIFYIFPMAALELGYAVLTFEGPGQGIVIRRHGVPMRPDWETVVGKVLDFTEGYATAHPEFDLDLARIALVGSSMGGHLALRGAADPRIRACIAVDPFYTMFDLLKSRMPDPVTNTFVAGGFVPDAGWDYVFGLLGRFNPMTRWEFDFGRWMLGVPTAAQMLRRMQEYTLGTADGVGFLPRIRCPVLVTGARFSLYSQPEVSTQRIFEELVNVPLDQKEMWVAEDTAEGGLQSKVGAFTVLTTKSFAWLDRMFGIERKIHL
ncbi:alpha/beta-hydrolase [Aspergillus indologenus CBS 114.80]|uniref:Alpha/beta-hydrolase n=1 Tax=Aspergillus indologenus CBS 114.80 TaxID=1450541 RepID=A0A2V5I3U6_9EURO|nr:alpha/beta-hydrolase [Aspergillus indologenus CBS 114.80]